MTPEHRAMRPSNPSSDSRAGLISSLLIVVFTAVPLSAQEVIYAPPVEDFEPAILRNQTPPPPDRPAPSARRPYMVGPVSIHPRLSYSYRHADGLPSKGGERVVTEIHTLTTGFSADLTQHWAFDFRPTWTKYTSGSMSDSFGYSASLNGTGSVG